MLQYYLIENKVTPDPDDYRAQPVTRGSVDDDVLVDHMIGKGSTITRAEAFANLMEYGDAVNFFLKAGYSINSRLVKIAPSISGVFTHEDDTFDANRHQLKFKYRPGSQLKDAASKVKLTKVDNHQAVPVPKHIFDVASKTKNDQLTPGGTAKLTGRKMRIDESADHQGIYLIDGNKNAIKIEDIIANRASEIVFVIPEGLAPGAYDLEVRGQINTSVRTGYLEAVLTVA